MGDIPDLLKAGAPHPPLVHDDGSSRLRTSTPVRTPTQGEIREFVPSAKMVEEVVRQVEGIVRQASTIGPDFVSLANKVEEMGRQASTIRPAVASLAKRVEGMGRQASTIGPALSKPLETSGEAEVKLSGTSYKGLGYRQFMSILGKDENLRNIEGIRFSWNGDPVPPRIFDLLGLQTLDLGRNRLTKIPKEIKNLKQLAIFCVSNNCLKDLPPEIQNLTKLQCLFLENNRIEKFPKEIGSFTQLVGLNLAGNKITEVPLDILGSLLRRDCVINLIGNPLSEKTRTQLASLKKQYPWLSY